MNSKPTTDTLSSPLPSGKQEYTITVYSEDQIGILNRISIIFSRRKINIHTLNTSPSEVPGIHRFNIVIDETEEVVKKLVRQIEKQVDVLKAYYNNNDEIIWQFFCLIPSRGDLPIRRLAESG